MRVARWYAGLSACVVTAALAGCGGGGEGASPAAGGTAAATGTAKASAKSATKAAGKVTTSTLGAMPPVLSSGRSGVDSGAVSSLADLPAAFGCPASVRPIDLPATPTSPAGLVCTSKLAGDEAVFLWYVGTPDERYLALQTALAKAKFVRGGSTWVAGGMLSAQMGDVGGDVYK